MSACVTIRNARRADLVPMAQVFVAAFPESVQHYAGRNIAPTAVADAFAICFDAEPQGCFVAETEGGEVVGYILAPTHLSRVFRVAFTHGHLLRMSWRYLTAQYGLGLRPVRVAARNMLGLWRDSRDRALECDARILSVAVRPDFQGRGVGTALSRRGLDYLAAENALRVRLEVRPGNAAALNMYQKLGFAVKGQTRDSQGEWLIMLKENGKGSDA